MNPPPSEANPAANGLSSIRWEPADQAYVVEAYRLVRDLLRDHRLALGDVAGMVARLSRRTGGRLSHLALLVGTTHPFQNEPAHTPARSWFRDTVAATLRAWGVDRISEWVSDRLAGLADDDVADAVPLLAEALPETIVAEASGLQPADIHRIADLSRRMSDLWSSRLHPLAELLRLDSTAAQIVAILDAKTDAGPAAAPRDRHTYAQLAFLVSAGVETTAGALASGMEILAHAPHLQERLRLFPHLVPAFAEEVLRLHPPLRRNVARVAESDMIVDGLRLEKGVRILLHIERANRDPSVYPDPDLLDVEREGPAHLAFGGGAHACIGAMIARLELRSAFETITAGYILEPAGPSRLRPSPTLRQYETLPVRFLRRTRQA